MKKDWTYKKLGEVGEVIGGTTPSTSNPAFWNGDLCWISPAELQGEHYLYDSVKKITREAVKAKSLKQLPVGTVILSSRAPIGKLAINKVPMYCNQGFKCVVCGKELYNEYLYWWFYFKKDYLNSLGTGATFPEISKSVVENIPIPLPPLSEQQEIVSHLDAAFGEIEGLKAKAEAQLREARTLFQAALTKEMKPKQGWEEKKLKEMSLLITKGSSPKWQGNSYVDYGGILFVTSENVREGCLEFKPAKYVDSSFNIKQRRSILKKDDVLVNIVGASIGRAAIFDLDVENANINQAVCLIRLNKEVLSSKYLCLFLNSENAFKQYSSMVKDTARANLSLDNIGNLSIGIPPLSAQQSIVSRLDALSEKVRELEETQKKVIAECDALKQALLREVFE